MAGTNLESAFSQCSRRGRRNAVVDAHDGLSMDNYKYFIALFLEKLHSDVECAQGDAAAPDTCPPNRQQLTRSARYRHRRDAVPDAIDAIDVNAVYDSSLVASVAVSTLSV